MGEPSPTYRAVLGAPRFLPIYLVSALSGWGDFIARVTIAGVVYNRTSSPMATGLTLAVSMLPSVFGRSLLGPLVDRLPARQVLLACHLSRALAVIVLLGLLLVQAPIWTLLAALFVLEALGGPAPAASMVLLTELFPDRRQYAKAMALQSLTEQANQAIGFAVGGLLVGFLGPTTSLVVDLASFVIAAAVIYRWAPSKARTGEASAGLRGWGNDLAVAARALGQDRVLTVLLAQSVISAIAIATPEAVAIPYAEGPRLGGVLMGSLMAGAVVGLLAMGALPVERANALIRPMCLMMPLPLLVTWWHPPIWLTALLWGVSGCLQAFMLPLMSTFALITPEQLRGRVLGFAGAFSLLMTGMAFLVAGWVGEHIGAAATVFYAALVATVGTVALSVAWPRHQLRDAVQRVYGH